LVYGKIETSRLRISGKKHGGSATMILCDTNVIIDETIKFQDLKKIGALYPY